MEVVSFVGANCLDSVCRTCLCDLKEAIAFNVNDLLVQKHDDTAINTEILAIKEVLLKCTLIQINAEDDLPKSLCQQCVSDLNRTYEFIQKCHKSQRTLQTTIALKHNDSEDAAIITKNEIDLNLTDSNDGFEEFSIKLEEEDDEDIAEPPEVEAVSTEKVRLYCEHCDKQFGNFDEFNRHKKAVKHPKVRRHECPQCQKSFHAPNVLAEHMRTHTKERPYACDQCPATFTIKSNLKRHGLVHSGVRPYTCGNCSKAFAKKVALQVHMRTHTGETPYSCKYCDRHFKQSGTLAVHLRTRHNHTNTTSTPTTQPRTHECPTCKRRLSSKKALELHEQRAHTTKNFLCSECGHRYASKKSLEIHYMVHRDERPYVCDYCGKRFRQQPALQSHVYTHTGETPYTCECCGKQFRQRAHLRIHVRTQHTKERPYVCRFCEKTFGIRAVLTVHERTHTGEKPYECEVCGKRFYDASSKRKHVLKHAKEDDGEVVVKKEEKEEESDSS